MAAASRTSFPLVPVIHKGTAALPQQLRAPGALICHPPFQTGTGSGQQLPWPHLGDNGSGETGKDKWEII